MDKIWDRKPFEVGGSLAVVAGMKKPNDHAEPTKAECLNKKSLIFHFDLYYLHLFLVLDVVWAYRRMFLHTLLSASVKYSTSSSQGSVRKRVNTL